MTLSDLPPEILTVIANDVGVYDLVSVQSVNRYLRRYFAQSGRVAMVSERLIRVLRKYHETGELWERYVGNDVPGWRRHQFRKPRAVDMNVVQSIETHFEAKLPIEYRRYITECSPNPTNTLDDDDLPGGLSIGSGLHGYGLWFPPVYKQNTTKVCYLTAAVFPSGPLAKEARLTKLHSSGENSMHKWPFFSTILWKGNLHTAGTDQPTSVTMVVINGPMKGAIYRTKDNWPIAVLQNDDFLEYMEEWLTDAYDYLKEHVNMG